MSSPLVSIGVPVYNGMPQLRIAIESLLKQTYGNIELLIADNASDDGTSEYCRALAEVHPHVTYVRHARNIGPAENFRHVLNRAKGKYFMWAAHDDRWQPQYVDALVESLTGNEAAVLATPGVIHIDHEGQFCSEPPDRPAPGTSAKANLKRLYNDHAATWIYGLWRTDWLQQHFQEYLDLPYWGADVLWLADVCLRHPIVGSQDAVIYKRFRRNSYAPQTARAAVAFWLYMFYYLSRTSFRHARGWLERIALLSVSWRYVYRLCIRRPYPLRTAWRVVRMVSLAAVTSIVPGLLYLARRRRQQVLAKRSAVLSEATAVSVARAA